MNFQQLRLSSVIDQICKEKNVDCDIIVKALEDAMLSVAKKSLGTDSDLEARYNKNLDEIEIYEFKEITDSNCTSSGEIKFDDAKLLDPGLTRDEIGEDLGIKIDSGRFGRIAAQNVKQMISQRLREAERALIYREYRDRKGEIITGTFRRFDKGSMIIDLGRAEGIIGPREQVQNETLRIGDRVTAYVLDVLEVSRGPQVLLSRSNSNLVAKLFEQEVPEVSEGIVNIKGVARDPGYRAKISVESNDLDVDPVGACVGIRGSRVQAVVQELRNEKIDIVSFDEDAARFVCNALAPAEVTRVLVNEADRGMRIVVPDDQLSLAIGRRGQNVRLAAELTGWTLDISPETRVTEEKELAHASLSSIRELSELQLQTLYIHGLASVSDVKDAEIAFLESLPGIDKEKAREIKNNAMAAAKKELDSISCVKENAREQARLLSTLANISSEEIEFNKITKHASFEDFSVPKDSVYLDIIDIYLDKHTERLSVNFKITTQKAMQLHYLSSLILNAATRGLVPLDEAPSNKDAM